MRAKDIDSRIHCVEDARHYAERRLPRFMYQRFEAGSAQGLTVQANLEAFADVEFHPRVATLAKDPDLRTTILGTEIAMPVLLAPVGVLRIGHPDGEAGVARAASKMGTVAIVSSSSGTAIEEVAAAAEGPVFYQLHYFGGRRCAESMIARAKASGCVALIVTLDLQARSLARERPVREQAYAPDSLRAGAVMKVLPQVLRHPAWLLGFLRSRYGLTLPMAPLIDDRPLTIFNMNQALFERPVVWDDLPWIRDQWNGPLGVKGIITVDDARRAADMGVSTIIVSNHGGNGLDGKPATLRVLPKVVDALSGEVEILMDGGIRRGSDIVKALALGAKAVLVGRAYTYGLLAGGRRGVERILGILHEEIGQTLALLGCPSLAELDQSYLSVPQNEYSAISRSDSRNPRRSSTFFHETTVEGLTAMLRHYSTGVWGTTRTAEIESSIIKAAQHLYVLAEHELGAEGDEPFDPPHVNGRDTS